PSLATSLASAQGHPMQQPNYTVCEQFHHLDQRWWASMACCPTIHPDRCALVRAAPPWCQPLSDARRGSIDHHAPLGALQPQTLDPRCEQRERHRHDARGESVGEGHPCKQTEARDIAIEETDQEPLGEVEHDGAAEREPECGEQVPPPDALRHPPDGEE